MSDSLVFGILAGLGLFLLLCGVMVHLKRWLRLLLMNGLFPGQPALATTWLGLSLCLLGAGGLVGMDRLPDSVSGLLGLILFPAMVAGVIGMFWYPMFLRPRWMRRDAELEAKGEDLFAKRFLQGQGQPSDGQQQ
ncbi:hypothetical protein [Arthrobacter koreensis]|uniref:hypothetical protein n=1 Tax=Arthrobacter koreensis TaxID=199136 RepID=UPI002DB7D8DB|nr:hypothetical protein [Arthrobacter koreensis]MEB7503575.1 hypothetical protein [Arthrobacter koreensis]